MLTTREPSSVTVVTEDVGRRIKERRTRIGMPVKALAERAGVDRGRLAAIEAGSATNVRPATIGAIERALDVLEVQMGIVEHEPTVGAERIGEPEDDLVEFIIEGTDGIRAIVKGPVRNMDELQAAARKLIEGLKTGDPKENDG
jgi:transcriptional regulator with XRE-family HTH domain